MLKPGDDVRVVNCCEAERNKERIWEVRSESWNCCGSEVVLLKGKAGGFDVNCLEKI